jgi:WD40 repeat protein
MEFPCQEIDCHKELEMSCICDSKVRFCSLHFISVHQKLPGTHDYIIMSEKIKNFRSKVQEACKNLKKAKISVLSKGNSMLNIITSVTQKNLSELAAKKFEIKKILKSKNDLQENFTLLEKVMGFEVLGDSIDNFEEIIKTYIRIHSNYDGTKNLSIEIKKILKDNERMRGEIFQLKENPTTLETGNEIEYDDLLKNQEILAEKHGLILQGHVDPVYCVAITSDSKYILSGSGDKTIRVWSLGTKTQQAVLKGHTGSVRSLVVTSDSKYIVSGSFDKTIRLWNFDSKTQEAVLQGHTDSVRTVVITSDNKYIISGSWDKTIRVWSLNNKTQEAVLKGHTDWVSSIVITTNNKYFISGSGDKTVRLWNLENKAQEAVLQVHNHWVNTIALTSDNKYVVSGVETTVKVWNFNKKTQEATLKGHNSFVTSVRITNDSKYIISGSEDKTVRIWNLDKKTQEALLQGYSGWISSLAITNNGKRVVYGSEDCTVRIWNLSNTPEQPVLEKDSYETIDKEKLIKYN